MTDASPAAISEEIARAAEGGEPVLVATLISAPEANSERVGAKLLVREDGSHLGTLGFFPLNSAIKDGAAEAFRRHRTHTRYLSPKGEDLTRQDAGPDSFQVMVEVYEQPCSLVIAGGGHVGKALSEIASLCGFRVMVIDDRPEYANEERFPEADRVIRGRFEEILTDYPLDPTTYVVAVTRGHRHDESSLRAVVGRGAAYVGMIGSKRRAAAVLSHLRETGMDAAALVEVRTPIGLDIGAESPEEIAVSIMAEIIMHRRRRGTGAPLKLK
ncbi:MAG TPA: XdhC/CoxI family protein [Dehalococcoidia bacterium]|nr:XdhC/CoxI family protein [Dehalococcoidia bacterium]